jgi:hypothetical protein
MKLKPKNKWMHVQFLGRGTRTMPSGLQIPENEPEGQDTVSLKIVTVPDGCQYEVGQTVISRQMMCVPIRPERESQLETLPEEEEFFGMLLEEHVMAVIDEES